MSPLPAPSTWAGVGRLATRNGFSKPSAPPLPPQAHAAVTVVAAPAGGALWARTPTSSADTLQKIIIQRENRPRIPAPLLAASSPVSGWAGTGPPDRWR